MFVIPLIVSALMIQTLSIIQGWILQQTMSLEHKILHMATLSDDHFVMQNEQSIHISSFDQPQTILRLITSEFNANVPFSLSYEDSSLIYAEGNTIESEVFKGEQYYQIWEVSAGTAALRHAGKICYFNSKVSQFLRVFDIKTQRVYNGPQLRENLSDFHAEIQISLTLDLLYINNLPYFTIISLTNLTIVNQFTLNQSKTGLIQISPTGLFVQIRNGNQYNIYRWKEQQKNYIQIIELYEEEGLTVTGLYCSEETGLCTYLNYNINKKQAENVLMRRISAANTYDVITDRVKDIDICFVSESMQNLLTLKFNQNSINVSVFMIDSTNYKFIFSLELDLNLTIDNLDVVRYKQNYEWLMISTMQGQLHLWDLLNKEQICSILMGGRLKIINGKSFASFDDNNTYFYFVTTQNDNIINILTISDCTVTPYNYHKTITDFTFTNIHCVVIFDDKELIQFEPVTFNLISSHYLKTTRNILVHSNLFGLSIRNNQIFIVSYDNFYKVRNEVLIICNHPNNLVYIGGKGNLDVTCDHAHHIYDTFPEYVGSFTVFNQYNHQDTTFHQTFKERIIIDKQTSDQHSVFRNYWAFKLYQLQDKAIRYFLMKDQDTLIYMYTNSKGIISLAYASLDTVDNYITISKTVSTDIIENQINGITSPLKWTCKKKHFMLAYRSKEGTMEHISIYETDSLMVTYSTLFRIETAKDQIGFHMNCDYILTLSLSEKVKTIDITQRMTIQTGVIKYLNGSLALNSDGSYLAVSGATINGFSFIELWQRSPPKFMSNFNLTDRKIDKILIKNETYYLFILSQDKLYLIIDQQIIVIAEEVKDCQIIDNLYAACLFFNNQIRNVSLKGKKQEMSPNYEFISSTSSKVILSPSKDIAYSFDGDNIINFYHLNDYTKPFSSLSSKQPQISHSIISTDKRKLLTYSQPDNTLVSWRYGSCSQGQILSDHKCICPPGLISSNGKCVCKSGSFLNGDTCQLCDFLCSQCNQTSSNCDSYSAGAILLIVSSIIVIIIASILLLRWLKKRKNSKIDTELNNSLAELEDSYKQIH